MRSAPWTSVTREPKRAKICAKLEPDRPAADDEQRLGELGQLERGDVVDPVDVADALDRRDRGARARRDQDPLGTELLVADAYGTGRAQLGLTPERVEPCVPEVLRPLRIALLERVLARLDPREVERGRPDVDAQLLASRSMSWKSSATTRYAFVGLQATFGQLPPQRVLSTSATLASHC
jgi:hypothetical protein